jgi:hypothetical protein
MRTHVGSLTQTLAMRQKQASIEQNFPQVRVSSLHANFIKKCCWLFLLRLQPANALDRGTLLAIG